MESDEPVELTGEELESVIEENSVVVVDFYADWCAPCKQMEPIMESVAEEMSDEAFIGKVNVDEEKEAATSYQVSSIPAVLFFKDGELEERTVGAKTKETLKEKIEDLAD